MKPEWHEAGIRTKGGVGNSPGDEEHLAPAGARQPLAQDGTAEAEAPGTEAKAPEKHRSG